MGTVFLATAVAWSLAFVLDEYARYAIIITAPDTLPGGPMALWIGSWIWIPGTALLFFAMPILFPDGHLPSPRWRPVAAFVVVGTVLSMVGHAAVVWPLRDTMLPFGPNFIAADQPGLAGAIASIGDLIMFVPAPVIAVVALVMRYRRSTGVAREQMRLLTFTIVVTIPLAVSTQLVNTVLPLANAVAGVAIAFIPIALTAAILRYHLYDIDRIIGRTLAYAVVTSLLAAVFVASNLVLQAVVAGATGDSTIAVAGSTLLVATLFQPIRRRVQGALDRRFDRGHVDAAKVISAFGVRARDEVDLVTLNAAVVLAAGEAVSPTSASMWLRHFRTGNERYGYAARFLRPAPAPRPSIRAPGVGRGSRPARARRRQPAPSAQDTPNSWALPVFTLIAASWGVVGAIIATRQSRNIVQAWQLWLVGTLTATRISPAAGRRRASLLYFDRSLPFSDWALWLTIPFNAVLGVAVLLMPLQFPDGRLVSRRWRIVEAVALGAIAATFVGGAVRPGPLSPGGPPSPAGVSTASPVRGQLLTAAGTSRSSRSCRWSSRRSSSVSGVGSRSSASSSSGSRGRWRSPARRSRWRP